ncbi:MAG: hypothetical protein QOG63_2904, partial [Thermoleophilaceae bacterium]|nr:hypothetical protein [Thermoleophilaceae bacterium]
MKVRRSICAVVAAVVCLSAAGSASATPVATDDASYGFLGAVFPDPQAGCPGGGACDPKARGQVPSTQFIGVDEFRDALLYMNQKPEWNRYMEVWALDGQYDGDANGPGNMFPGDSLPLEFDPKAEYVSAGLPTTGLGRRKSDLVVVRVTDESVPDRGKKRYALSLSIHGIERAGAEGGTRAMEDLVTAATTGRSNAPIVPDTVKKGAPTFADVLKHTIIYFTYPNPDGWRRGSVSSGGVFFQRYNGNGVDPNRDWPDIGFSFRPYSSVSEPETQAWISFYNDVKRKTGDRFDAGDDLHGQPEADALSYTLLPHGRHRLGKNNRIQETAKRINRSTYESIKWSPIVQDNDQPQGGGAPCVPTQAVGDACSQIYAQTWGTVFDTINYTTTGALGDWFDSSIGLGADGIDNEMSFSHLDKNINYEPNTEQLHVAGNKALIYAHLTEMLQPTFDTSFDAKGRKGYVENVRVKRGGSKNFPAAPPGTHPDGPQDGDVVVAPDPDEGAAAIFAISVKRSDTIYSGGMRVEATNGNIAGIGTGSVNLKIQCRNCDRHPGVKSSSDWITVAEDFNQSAAYAQAGVVATVNDPQPNGRDGKPTEWRAVASGPTGAVHFHVVFTQGPASTSGDTGGGPPPEQRAYDVANTDFYSDLNGFMPGGQDFRPINPHAVIAGRQSLEAYDTIALSDDALPGYTGAYGRHTPSGGPTKDVPLDGSIPSPGGGSGAPGTFQETEFTIGPNDANKSLTATIKWADPNNDFDLYLYKNDGGQQTLVAQSAGGPPSDTESLTVEDPQAGDYVVHVDNFASSDPAFTGSVKFTAAKGTGAYSDDERAIWLGELKTWVRNGGNLVLTDGAIQALKDMTPMPPTAVSMHKVYAGQSSFATDASHPT